MNDRYKKIVVLSITILGIAACSPNNVTKDSSLNTYFEQHHLTGSFGMFDNGAGNFFVHNLERFKDSAYQPGFTFSIISSLVGIETGRVRDEKIMLPLNAISFTDTSFSGKAESNMEQAFKLHTTEYFHTLNNTIGKDTLQHWLDTLGYGSLVNKYKIVDLQKFWMDNSLKVTADEQLGLMKKLYFKQLPFQQRCQTIVKEQLSQEANSNYSISYINSNSIAVNNRYNNWIAGWIEENKHPYFFVLHTDGNTATNLPESSKQLLYDILKHYGFFEGKR